MRRNRIIPIVLIVAITLLSFGSALAAPLAQDPTPGPCPVGTVSGTVVAVDPATGTVTVDTGGGVLCTVNVNIDESHPIALLLGQYFGDLNPETLTAALKEATETVTGCAMDNGDGTWSWVAKEGEDCPTDSVEVKVTSYDSQTGAYTAQPVGGGEPISLLIDDPDAAEAVQGALETLLVEWALESDGNLQTVSDQIAQYHEDGMGFGVLVKLYAIAEEELAECPPPAEGETAECTPATVDELVTLFQSGVGMGQIFKTYGKPDKVGVGHVRQAMDDKQTGQDKIKNNKNKGGDDPSGDVSATNTAVKKNGKPAKDNTLKGACNAIAKNGKPKKNVTCP